MAFISFVTASLLVSLVNGQSSGSATITTAPAATTVQAAVISGTSPLPLTQYHFTYPDLPYQVNPFNYLRGPQTGYNLCNDTTAGPESLCQTAFFSNISDFCLWGSPTANGAIGDIEAEVIAFCTQNTHGARVIPAGTIKSLQYTRTSAYIQIVGTLDQTGINILAGDTGGELDPHGADLLGNPLGGLVYSSGMPTTNGTITQVNNWNLFVGSNTFCFKACDNSVTSPNYCQNKYDLIGCNYNMPSNAYNATDGTFEACEGDLQDPAGIYTSNGQVLTYSQPDPLVDAPPYTPRIPASSNCVTYQSTDLFGAAATSAASSSQATSSGASQPTSAGASRSSGSTAPSSSSSSGNSAARVSGSSGAWFGLVMAVVGALAAPALLL